MPQRRALNRFQHPVNQSAASDQPSVRALVRPEPADIGDELAARHYDGRQAHRGTENIARVEDRNALSARNRHTCEDPDDKIVDNCEDARAIAPDLRMPTDPSRVDP